MLEALPQHRLIDILDRWSKTDRHADAFAIYLDVAAEYGFDQINYFDMTGYVVGETPDRQSVKVSENNIWTFNVSWFDYYMDRGYGSHDPVFPWLCTARRPFAWDEAARSNDLTLQQTQIMDEAKEAGINNGFSVPLHGPNGQLSAICVASSTQDVAIAEGFQICGLLGQHFHHISLGLQSVPKESAALPRLTLREREVLQWCAQGKSNWTIGEILGISEHSVKFHIQNIYKKLDANSRIAAVVKAIRLGLIQP